MDQDLVVSAQQGDQRAFEVLTVADQPRLFKVAYGILQTAVVRAPDAYHEVIDRDALERGFQRLSIDHRAVIVLRYLLDMTPEEVAETLDIPRKTVYSRLERAVQAMRGAIEADARTAPPTGDRHEVVR